LTLVLLFPLFHWMASAANPQMATAMQRNPVVVTGTNCSFDPFASKGQATACGRVLDTLSKKGVAYSISDSGGAGAQPVVAIGNQSVDPTDAAALDAALDSAGYKIAKADPTFGQAAQVVLAIVIIGFLSGMTYGPVAALLVELFPAKVRYTSMSVPYHIGTGYFGGFLPFISQYIVAKTGDPYAGLWYTWAVVLMALLVSLWGLKWKGDKLAE